MAGSNYVAYNIAQTRSDSEQAQARNNIGAAAQDYVTPEMFGAKGDGTTDDTAALQEAINEAIQNKKVLRGFNSYKTTNTVQINYTIVSNSGVYIFLNKIIYTGNQYAFSFTRCQKSKIEINYFQSTTGGCFDTTAPSGNSFTYNELYVHHARTYKEILYAKYYGDNGSNYYNKLTCNLITSTNSSVDSRIVKFEFTNYTGMWKLQQYTFNIDTINRSNQDAFPFEGLNNCFINNLKLENCNKWFLNCSVYLNSERTTEISSSKILLDIDYNIPREFHGEIRYIYSSIPLASVRTYNEKSTQELIDDGIITISPTRSISFVCNGTMAASSSSGVQRFEKACLFEGHFIVNSSVWIRNEFSIDTTITDKIVGGVLDEKLGTNFFVFTDDCSVSIPIGYGIGSNSINEILIEQKDGAIGKIINDIGTAIFDGTLLGDGLYKLSFVSTRHGVLQYLDRRYESIMIEKLNVVT